MLTIGKHFLPESSPYEGVSLYFHIPFCSRKCDYCHFYVLPDKEDLKKQLLKGFSLEWERMLPLLKDKTVTSIYFGGGTPFLFGPERIASVLQWIKSSLSFTTPTIEITLEVNPENIEFDVIQAYAQAGINRVSIGIQTLDAHLLTLLGRQHSPTKALEAVEIAYRAGVPNISIDLMYDLPKQSIIHWENTLERIRDLPITHLSLYNLTIEPHTLFFKRQAELKPLIPDEEISLHMYEMAVEKLTDQGLVQYEISAFAKPNFHSRHNSGYWTARPFIGYGPSAYSYWEGSRFRNVAHLGKYVAALEDSRSPVDFEEKLDPQARRRELLVIQLRLLGGVRLDRFESNYGPLDQHTHQVIQTLIQDGLLNKENNVLRLSKRGILFYDSVATDLI